MPYFALLLFLLPCLANAQSDLSDTTYHDNGSIATVSYYTVKLSEELTKAELFQRGLSHLAAGDTIYLRDSIRMWDKKGNRLEEGEQPRPPILPSRARRYPNGRPDTDPFLPSTYLSGYLGRPHHDTLKMGRATGMRSGKLVRLFTEHPAMPLDTMVVLNAAVNLGIPVVLYPDTGSHRVKVTIDDPATDRQLSFPVTIEGYDLSRRNFAATPADRPDLVLSKARKRLLLHLPGTEKLLTVSSNGEVLNRYSVGRGRDEIPIAAWVKGDYLLRLRDLGSDEDTFAVLRLE